jgi:hypothetical protein
MARAARIDLCRELAPGPDTSTQTAHARLEGGAGHSFELVITGGWPRHAPLLFVRISAPRSFAGRLGGTRARPRLGVCLPWLPSTAGTRSPRRRGLATSRYPRLAQSLQRRRSGEADRRPHVQPDPVAIAAHFQALTTQIEAGPTLSIQGVVRWRLFCLDP